MDHFFTYVQAPKLNASTCGSQILTTTLFSKVRLESLAGKAAVAQRQAPLCKSSVVQETANHAAKRKHNMLRKKNSIFCMNLLLQLHTPVAQRRAPLRRVPILRTCAQLGSLHFD